MDDSVLVEQTIEIAAPIEVVFELITTAQGLSEWMAAEAVSELEVGGLLRWRHENGAVMSGRFVEVRRPTRVVFTYGWEAGGPADVPPGSTEVTIDLAEHGGQTRLQLVHRRLPRVRADEHRHGWSWFLQRLAARAAGRAPSGDCEIDQHTARRLS